MFFSHSILGKKAPLGTIWIAAHLERKLRREQIMDTNIVASVDSILFPEVPIALRLSAHLLLGLVRIYSKKVNYVFCDCSEALIQIQQALKSSSVDLPPKAAKTPFCSVTNAETLDFEELESCLNHDDPFQGAYGSVVDYHVSTRDLITLQDCVDDRGHFGSPFTLDERFPEACHPDSVFDFDDEELFQEKPCYQEQIKFASLIQEVDVPTLEQDVLPPLPMDDDVDLETMDCGTKNEVATPATEIEKMEVYEQHERTWMPLSNQIKLDERFELLAARDNVLIYSNIPQELTRKALFQEGDSSSCLTRVNISPALMQDTAAPVASSSPQWGIELTSDSVYEGQDVEKLWSAMEAKEQGPLEIKSEEYGMLNMGARDMGRNSHNNTVFDECRSQVVEDTSILREPSHLYAPSPVTVRNPRDSAGDGAMLASVSGGRRPSALKATPSETSVSNQPTRAWRKRKPMFDDVATLSSIFMRKQLAFVEDLRRKRRKAPCTEYEIWRVQREPHVEQKFFYPSIPGLCDELQGLYNQDFISKTQLPALMQQQVLTSELVMQELQRNQTEGEHSVAEDMLIATIDASKIISRNLDTEQESVEVASQNTEIEAFVEMSNTEMVSPLPAEIAECTPEILVLFSSNRESAELAQQEDVIQVPGLLVDELCLHKPSKQVATAELSREMVKLENFMEQHVIAEQPQVLDLLHSEIEEEKQVQYKDEGSEEHTRVSRKGQGDMVKVYGEFGSVEEIRATGLQNEGTTFEVLFPLSKDIGFLAGLHQTNEDGVSKVANIFCDPKEIFSHDNCGWSSRTWVMMHYLWATFKNVEIERKFKTCQPARLSLNRLLKGRTRREAACIFFEVLVLKTKNYIHVEQDTGFGGIHLFATANLKNFFL